MLAAPGAVMCERDGRLWVADTGHGRVLGAERDGKVHTRLTGFERPCGMAIAAEARRLYVADPAARAVWAVDLPDGVPAVVAGELPGPHDVAVDEYDGWLYVALADAQQIVRIPIGGGAPAMLAGTFTAPRGLVLSPDRTRLYVADTGAAAIRVIDLRGGATSTLIERELDGCRDVTLSPAGVVVANTGRDEVRGVNPRHGSSVVIWRGADGLRLQAPGGVAFDLSDRSYVVADTGNDRLVRVARDGLRAAVLSLRD